MGKRGLVIFDIDGTLFDSRAATLPAVRRAFAEFGLAPPDPHRIQSFIGKQPREFRAWLGSICSAQRAAQLAATIDRYELDHIGGSATLYPGIPEALAEIGASVAQMAISSNGPPYYIARVLGAYQLEPLFQRVRYPRGVQDTKVLMVRELLDGLDGRPAVVVGDRGDDVQGAHENGIAAIAATYGYGSPQELAAAELKATCAAELPGMVRALTREQP